MDFAARLRRFREEAGLTQEELAHACGWKGQSRVANYEKAEGKNSREPSLDDLLVLARALKKSVDELLGAKSGTRSDETGWSNVLGYAQAVGLGNGVEAAEYAETHSLKFRAESLRRQGLNHRKLGVLYGKGDSMLPRIKSGDAIMFNEEQTAPEDETLFVILCQGINGSEYSVKRCRVFGSDVYFEALNPAGDHNWRKPRRKDDKKYPIQILGQVRWIGSWEGEK